MFHLSQNTLPLKYVLSPLLPLNVQCDFTNQTLARKLNLVNTGIQKEGKEGRRYRMKE